MLKVFLSSTARELATFREAVYRAICRVDDCHCVRMEDFGARSRSALEFCQDQVQRCDLFVTLVGVHYGSTPPDNETSYTVFEYEAAVTKQIPCLVFVSADSFSGPDLSPEEPRRQELQRQFRARLRGRHIIERFVAPDELAVKVGTSVSNWSRESRYQPNVETHTPERDAPRRVQSKSPKLGPLVNKLCDRSAQEEQFSMFFLQKATQAQHQPQVFFVRGYEHGCPESLVKRFGATTVQNYAHARWGLDRGLVNYRKISWPGSNVDSRRCLLQHLFRSFEPQYGLTQPVGFSAADFVGIGNLHLQPVSILYHELRIARWDRHPLQLIRWYLDFWSEVARCEPQFQVLVFLSIIYPPAWAQGWAARWWPHVPLARARRIESSLLRTLNRQQRLLTPDTRDAVAPCLLLRELSEVRREDVMDWFSRHDIYEEIGIRERICDEIFGRKTWRRMAEIETHLRGVCDRYHTLPAVP